MIDKFFPLFFLLREEQRETAKIKVASSAKIESGKELLRAHLSCLPAIFFLPRNATPKTEKREKMEAVIFPTKVAYTYHNEPPNVRSICWLGIKVLQLYPVNAKFTFLDQALAELTTS